MNRILGLLTPTIFCLLVIPCLSLPCLAQSSTATLSGTVEDERGGVIPNASVSVADPAKGLKRTVTTNENGAFTILLLPPSTYTVTVEQSGFAPVQLNDVVLNVGVQRSLQIQLKAGQVGETVTVTTASTVQETPEVATVVDRQFVENLPLNGRSFQSLIALTPGVVTTATSGAEQGQFSVNGQRADANYFTVDGVSANIGASAGALPGQQAGGSLPGLSASGGTNNLVSVDALQEFRVQTSTYAPEFGRSPGAQISIVTRSGTNRFSGTLFEYFRNDALDANDWFANRNGLKKPALRQNDFGGVLGGPLYLPRFGEGGPAFYNGRDRTFFFFSYEGLRLRQPTVGIKEVPSLSSRASAPAQIQPLLNAFPLPNGPDTSNGLAQFSASFSNPTTLNATSVRIDHAVNSNLALFGRYNHAPSEIVQRGSGFFSLNSLTVVESNTQTLTAGATWVISSSTSNDLRANYSRSRSVNSFFIDDFGGAILPPDSLFFPSFASREDSLYILLLGIGSGSNFIVGKNADNFQRQFNIVDTFSFATGSHQLKFGIDYRRLSPILAQAEYQQNVVFNGATGANTGRASTYANLSFAPPRYPIFTNLSLFAQDTWKVKPRLTLTYGLRWEVNPAPTEKNGNDAFAVVGLDNPATLALAPRGTPLYKTTYNNFAPRVGVSYQLSQAKGRETIIRGGFGIFYALGTGPAANGFGNSYPFVSQRAVFNVLYPIDPALIAPPTFSLNPPYGIIQVVDPNLKLPRTYQWNFAIEQSLGANQTVTAAYVAAAGRDLLRGDQLRNPNPNFTTVIVARNIAISDYHSMQLQFRRRLSRGLQALASYTWSKSLDSASEDSSLNPPEGKISIDQERGPSSFDVRHSFTAAVTYNIPAPATGAIANAILRNWSVDTIITARSATPVNVIIGTDPLLLGLTSAV